MVSERRLADGSAATARERLRANLFITGAASVGLLSVLLVADASAQQTAQQSATTLPPLEVSAKKAKGKRASGKSTPEAVAPAEKVEQTAPVRADAARRQTDFTTPAAVRTVTSEEIDQIGANRSDDLLRTVPGIFTQSQVRTPGLSVNVRGMQDFGRTSVLIDGARQNFQFTGHGPNGTVYVDPALVRSIDIQKGVVTSEGGAGALGGVVNFRTIELDDILTGGKNYGGEITTTYGTNGYGWAKTLATGIRNDAISVFGALSLRDSDTYKDGDGKEVKQTAQDLVSGVAKIGLRPDASQTWDFGLVSYDNAFEAASADYHAKVLTLTSKYRYAPASSLIDLRFNTFYNKTQLDQDFVAFIKGEQITYNAEGIGGDLTNVSRFRLGAFDIKAKYGVEGFYDWVETDDIGKDQTAPGLTPKGERGIASAFSEVTATQGPFDLIAAARVDHYALQGAGNNLVAGGGTQGIPEFGVIPNVPVGPFEVDKSETAVSPKFTASYRPTKWLQLYSSYGWGFRPPTITETLMAGKHPGGPGAIVKFFPNPFLDPERMRGWEVGTNIVLDGIVTSRDSFRFKASYFANDVKDYITSLANVCLSPKANICYFYDNVRGTTEVKGFELEVGYDARFAFASLAYHNIKNTLPDPMAGLGYFVQQPEKVWTLTAGIRLFDERLVIGGRIRDVSESGRQYAVLEAYRLYDAFASFKVNDHYDLTFTAENLTDEVYIPAMSTDMLNAPGLTMKFGVKARL